MMQKKNLCVLAVLAMALTLAFFAWGCGGDSGTILPGGGAESDTGEENGASGETGAIEEALLELDNWSLPTSVAELIATFSEYKLRMNMGLEQIFHYRYLGSEPIEGVETEKIAFSVDGEEITIWVAADDMVKQVELEGKIYTGEMAETMGATFLGLMVMPFAMAEGYNIHEYVSTPGLSVQLKDSSPGRVGDLSGTVHTIEIKIEPPANTAPTEITYICRIADLGAVQTMLSLSVTSGDGTVDFAFEIEELKLH